jgi:hypothetical protein
MSLARHHVPHLVARVSARRAETPRDLCVCVCMCVCVCLTMRTNAIILGMIKPWQSGAPCVSARSGFT